jgi:hypothetical protein
MLETLFAVLISAMTLEPNTALMALQERCRQAGGKMDVTQASITVTGRDGVDSNLPVYHARCTVQRQVN